MDSVASSLFVVGAGAVVVVLAGQVLEPSTCQKAHLDV